MTRILQSVRFHLHSLPLVLFIISLVGCAAQTDSSANHYYRVRDHNKRESSLGFSIRPPAGRDWLEKLSDQSLYYLKQTQTSTYAIYTKATEIRLTSVDRQADKFFQFVKTSQESNVNSGAYRNVSATFSPDTELSPLCVRYYLKYEDHMEKNLKPREFIKIRRNGLMCMHPDSPDVGVDMFYVESVLQSRGPVSHSYWEEGESFLSSLQFHSPGKRG
jgi:hypothetical protein